MTSIPDAPDPVARARELLGPASAAWVAGEAGSAAVRAALARGKDLDSALLGEAERRGRDDPLVHQEFLGCILGKMRSIGHGSLSPQLRRYFDTVDLVQSVAGDVFADGQSPEFEDLASFLSLLRQRLRWKAADHARKLDADKRREGRREAADLEDLPLSDPAHDPVEAGERTEFVAQLEAAMARLSERDQELLRLYLAGNEAREIAGRLGLTQETAGRVLRRAKERLRQLFEEG